MAKLNIPKPAKTPPKATVLKCPECGARMPWRMSKFGGFYSCERYPLCDGTHGAHPDGAPLGIPANRATKDARIKAHAAFDKLWKARLFPSRGQAYAWLGEQLGLARGECHIGRFDIDMCKKVVLGVEDFLNSRR